MADAPQPAEPTRDERMAALQEALGNGRRALEAAKPILDAIPAAFTFLGHAYQLSVLADAAEKDFAAVSAKQADAAAALGATTDALGAAQRDHAAFLAASKAEADKTLADLTAAVKAARKAADADARGADAYAAKRRADLQAAIDGLQAEYDAKAAPLEAAFQARQEAMAKEEADARDRLASLTGQLEALRAKLA